MTQRLSRSHCSSNPCVVCGSHGRCRQWAGGIAYCGGPRLYSDLLARGAMYEDAVLFVPPRLIRVLRHLDLGIAP